MPDNASTSALRSIKYRPSPVCGERVAEGRAEGLRPTENMSSAVLRDSSVALYLAIHPSASWIVRLP